MYAHYQSLGEAVSSLSSLLDFTGPSRLVTTACSSSTQASALGMMWINEGKVKRCLVGGAEVLCRLTVEGFRCLQLLSQSPCAPFDQNRKGINLSEAAAFFCLESSSASRAKAYISGYGMSSDAYHLTAPHPEGQGCFVAMQSALEVAGLKPSDISAIHAHGTGSTANDVAESIATQRLFGAELEKMPWIFSTKGIHGHSLGASGALESILSVKVLASGSVLPTAGLVQADPALKLKHPRGVEPLTTRHLLKNSLGFGGANASLVLSAIAERPQ
jgi:3-oxoacyl-(acyl-carrier-protein) synthase